MRIYQIQMFGSLQGKITQPLNIGNLLKKASNTKTLEYLFERFSNINEQQTLSI